jgi:hypothetical protein
MRIPFAIILLFTTWLSTAFANPSDCIPVPLTVQEKNITLPGAQDAKTPVVYFFQNKSLQSVWIDHPDQSRRGVSAGWASYLRPGNWSALVLNKKNFSVSCSMIQPGKVEALDCSKTLSICQPQNITSPKPFQGNSWLAEDKKWEAFVKLLQKKNIQW